MSNTNFDDDEDFTNLDRGNDFEGSEDEDLDEDEEIEEESDEDNEDSDDDESEETEEDQDDEDEEEEPAPKSKDVKIPKSRLDKALKQRDELRERSLWLEEQLEKLINISAQPKQQEPQTPPAPTYDFDLAEEQYANLLIEGDTVKAAKLRKEIEFERQKEIRNLIADIKKSNEDEVSAKIKSANETEKFNTLIKSYEGKYTFLNADSDDANEEAIDTINALMSGYLAKGNSKSEALKKAVEKVVPMYSKETPAKKSLGKERKIEAGKKAANAAKSQPTKTKSSTSTTIDSSKLNIAKMSERDFAKLTPRELKALRGD